MTKPMKGYRFVLIWTSMIYLQMLHKYIYSYSSFILIFTTS